MRKILLLCTVLILSAGCKKNFLDRRPTDKLDSKALFADPLVGTRVYMANLYGQLPIEDFRFYDRGWSYVEWMAPSVVTTAFLTDESIHSQWDVKLADGGTSWWEPGYKLIRDVNLLIDLLPELSMTEDNRKMIMSECSFIRAFAYFGLAKRYGGLPIIKTAQKYSNNVDELKVPRSTEKDTWDFVLSECDKAVESLPDVRSGDDKRRATKWAAYALKSRAALYAASIAKHWNKAPLSGEAVDKGLVGIPAAEANRYYDECIKAAAAIMNSGKYGLYKPTPASREEAANNYTTLFQDPNAAESGTAVEPIFIKGYAKVGEGHNYDLWYQPNQTSNGWANPGRMNPSLEFVDQYENYSTPGEAHPIVTTTDGDVNNYNGYDASRTYLRFDGPNDIFKDKDARLWGTAVLPGTTWKGKTIIIQGGYIQPDGVAKIETDANIVVNGTTYYTFGAANWTDYSGFNPSNLQMTRSGFSYKKFMQPALMPPVERNAITDWMEFRYAEVMLNFAEAAAESGASQAEGTKALNDLRRRAGHTVDIPLTIGSVLRERTVELAFENHRYWDLMRRRDFHTVFNNTSRRALVPVLDLRVTPAKYIFIRKTASKTVQITFLPKWYYVSIPGISANGLVQNPQY
ncbi:RagB/SusD family nutrient uptake outer membrane protein [Chitinophaga sp. SYP-B3965]|uniref:RagB/SusD family nutrient uptake outer membrane protein n=1 Tax=Chitinophaga sp. SYP-B3965 TaxID=2663120 RepID=UPI001C12C06C|nr:RagB/SusD family nutrient uptake outer membrane protein [Chitinophaga sp. SYP-B3965]